MAIVITRPGYTGSGWKYPLGTTSTVQTYKPKPVVTKPSKAAAAAKTNPVTAGQAALMNVLKSFQAQLLTPAQQRAQATASVQQQIDLALAGIRASAKAEQDQANQQALRAQGFAHAIGSLGQGDAASIAALYNDAASRTHALGTGLTGAVAAAQEAQQAEQQANVQQTTGGLGKLGGYDPAALRNVAQFTGVVRPSQDLAEEAANQGALATWKAKTDAGHIENIAQDYLAQATLAQQKLADQVAALQQTRPDLYQRALSDLQTGNRADLATIIQGLALANTYAQTPSKIAATEAGTTATQTGTKVTTAKAKNTDINGNPLDGYHWNSTDPKTRKSVPIPTGYTIDPKDPTQTRIIKDPKTAAATAGSKAAANKGKNLDANGNPLPNFHWDSTDPKTRKSVPIPKGYTIDPKDPTQTRIIRVPSTSKGGSKGGTTTSQISTITGALPSPDSPGSYAVDTTDAISKKLGDPPNWKPLYSWAVAFNRLLSRYPKDVRNRSDVRQAVTDALQSVGYKPPSKVTTKTTVTATGPAVTRTR